jgi:RecA/RadA recombinase
MSEFTPATGILDPARSLGDYVAPLANLNTPNKKTKEPKVAKKQESVEKKPANSWAKELKSYDDAVDYEYDSFAPENCLYTPSPYFNWIFANKSSGIPKNASVLFFSSPKAGKSLSIYALIAEMQKNDPEGIAIYFNTEMRGALQFGVIEGLDLDRMIIYDTNQATDIFDRVETDIKDMVARGMPLRIIAIDSINGIMGTKRDATDSVANHLVGDHALTIKNGLSKLVPFCKSKKIMLIGTAQMTANLDAGSYGPKEKMGASFYTRHAFEYYVSLKRAGAAEDKQDIEGKTMEDDIKDARGNKLVNAHKVYVKVEESSIGQAGRAGVFTMSYDKGIINQHEEIFFLAKSTGVVTTPNNRTFNYKDLTWNGKREAAFAIRDNPELAASILADVKKLDDK